MCTHSENHDSPMMAKSFVNRKISSLDSLLSGEFCDDDCCVGDRGVEES
jgi:hypothetical protein